MSAIDDLLAPVPVPRVVRVRQRFDSRKIEDVAAAARAAIGGHDLRRRIPAGSRVAVTAGSRGITELPLIIRTVVEELTAIGCLPFLIPAMGSHGGATADGQLSVLEHMGITEQSVGAPIVSSMSVVQIGTSASGLPVYMDENAYGADAIIVLNRIKPHVGFRGAYESGLMKMIAIGLGKQKGAETCHDMGFGEMARNIEEIARTAIEKGPIAYGLAILENAYHETAELHFMSAESIPDREPGLQERSKTLIPRIYFDALDVLIIDEIGKDISGTGFDNNVVGRYHTPYASGGPDIRRIAALDITEKSGGNGNGLGILDFTTRRAFEKFDFEQTYPNSLTSTVPTSVKIPMVLRTDRQAIQAAIKTCNRRDKQQVRLVRITNTLKLDEIEISENLLPEVERHDEMTALSSPYELAFDRDGNLARNP